MSCDLTVCICAYNAEKYIAETLESLKNQTYKNFKLLIINDCSTDRTVEIAESFRDGDWADFEIVSLPENGGLANARQIAEQQCETEFIGFIDADDVPLPNSIQKMYDVIKNDINCMVVSGYCEYISFCSQPIKGGIFIGPRNKKEFFQQAKNNKLMFIPPFNISRIKYLRAAGGRISTGFPQGRVRYQDMCEDLDLWTRMSDLYANGLYMVVIPEVIFKYRKISTSVSSNANAMLMRIRHIKKNLKLRRAGCKEMTFVEFLDQITLGQHIFYQYSDWSTGLYKKAGFYFMNAKYIRFVCCLACSAIFNPKYFTQKLLKNIIPSLKRG